MSTEIETLLKDHELYHSELQMDCFITARAGGITAYGRYKQALREIHKRWTALQQLDFSRELLLCDIVELKENAEAKKLSMGKAAKLRIEIQLRQKDAELHDLDFNIAETKRELDHFMSQAVPLKTLIGELTPERRRLLDQQMWRAKIYEMAAMDIAYGGRLQRETLSMIFSLPPVLREQIMTECQNHNALIEWLNKAEVQPPADVQKLWLPAPCKCKEHHDPQTP